MFRKTKYLPLVMLLFILMLTGCEGKSDLVNQTFPPMVKDSLPTITPSLSPNSSPLAGEENKEKEDDSIRAIGTHADGRFLIKPASKASVTRLGAPSCIGQETDLHWAGDYEVIWESKSNGISNKVMTFPNDFAIVQPDDKPVQMKKFTFVNTEIFAYIPRYTDCHGLETYLFGVSDGKTFPILFELKPEQILTNLSQLPHQSLQVNNGELILTGGYGAGQNFIDVYHFRYDLKKRSMILKSTDQVKPNDIVYDK